MQLSTQELKNFEFGNATDIGRVRSNNEDYLGYFETPNGYLFVICDGMGGHQAGEKASQLAVEFFKDFFNKDFYPSPQEALQRATVEANQLIYNTAQKYREYAGMGTTLVAALIRDNQVFYVHVGDSRLYYFESATKTLYRITKDHSFVQELVDRGIIKEEEAERHPRKNEILRSLGVSTEVIPDVGELPILPADNDLLLLCSDGLNSMINDAQIAKIITEKSLSILQRAQMLIEKANEAGGIDNITVQLIRFYAQHRKQATLPTNARKSISLKHPLQNKLTNNINYYIVGIIVGVLALLVATWAWQDSSSSENKNKGEDISQSKRPTPDSSQRVYPSESKKTTKEEEKLINKTEEIDVKKVSDTPISKKEEKIQTQKDEKGRIDRKDTENIESSKKPTDSKSHKPEKHNAKSSEKNKPKAEQK